MVIIEPVREMAFGDITTQGLPFYGGNIIYQLDVKVKEKGLTIRTPYYRGALVGVTVDGVYVGSIIEAPYTLNVPQLTQGEHKVSLILYGNRCNTFGALHNCSENWWWFGPDAYRTFGDEFSYEYNLRRTGILKSPEVIV